MEDSIIHVSLSAYSQIGEVDSKLIKIEQQMYISPKKVVKIYCMSFLTVLE